MASPERRRWLVVVALIATMLSLYVGSYIVMSRRGFADADHYDMEGFYFFTPEDTDAWRQKNFGCVYLFYPLIYIDNLIGTGSPIASEPLWNLS